MFKRLFFGLVGLGAGVTLGMVAVRKVEAAQARLRPGRLASDAQLRAGGMRGRLRAAVEQGRAAAAVKEAELRTRHRVPSTAPAAAETGASAEVPRAATGAASPTVAAMRGTVADNAGAQTSGGLER